MSERFMTNSASHAILINPKNQILMLRRFNTGWMDGMFTIPAGHIEQGETASGAAARELLEETGVSTATSELEHVMTVHRQNERGEVYFDNYFVANSWTGEPSIVEPNKSDVIEWLNMNHLPDNIVPSVLKALKAYLDGKHFLEDGWNQ